MRLVRSAVSPSGWILVLALGLVAAGCTEYHPRPAKTPPKQMEILNRMPPGHRVKSSLEAKAATTQKARDRLAHDAEREGCDALVITGEDTDSFEYHGEQVPREIVRADCVVRDASPTR